MKAILPILFLAVLFQSCSNSSSKEKLSLEKDFEDINVKGSFNMKIPKYMNPTTELNEDATVQYMNGLKETYLIVITEEKKDIESTFAVLGLKNDSLSLAENYFNYMIPDFKELIQSEESSLKKMVEVNGMNGVVEVFNGKVEGIDVAYFVEILEGESTIYYLMAWTLNKRKDRYSDTFFTILNSVKEE